MPRTCTICSHEQRAEIDAALVRPDSLRAVAGRFGTSKSALERHRDKCISEQLAKAKDISDVAAASSLIRELKELTKKTAALLARAVREKHADIALKAIARLERQLELKGRLLGQLEERGGGGATVVQVVYIDAKLPSGTTKSPHSLGNGKVIDLKTQGNLSSDPLLSQQKHRELTARSETDRDENVLGAPGRDDSAEGI